jgi:hypothetical protein
MTIEDDDPRLGPVVAQIAAAERGNAEPFDKAVLTLSSGALALSFTFAKDIVPPALAKHHWLLFSSWTAFVLALIVTTIGYLYALRGFKKQWHMAFDVFRHRRVADDKLQTLMEKHRGSLYRISVVQGILFLVGIATFTAYVMTNFR